MKTPSTNPLQQPGNNDNEMTSSAKTYVHENVGRKDIIEGYKVAHGGNSIGASIMSPEKIRADFETLSRDPFEANATDMTLPPERIREGGIGVTVAFALDAIWAANDAQRERQKCADEVKNVVENVLIDHETITKTKAFVVAMSNSLVATRVPFDADDHQYAKKAELLQASFDCTYGNEEGQRWIQVMGPYASSANSFYMMRPAICWQKKREMIETLRQLSALDTSREMSVLEELITQLMRQKNTLGILEQLKL